MPPRRLFVAFLTAFALCLSFTARRARAAALAENGTTAYVIVVARDAPPAEQTAARELREHLRRVTGATFPVRAEAAAAPRSPQILVGAGPRVRQLLPRVDWNGLGQDGIVIRTVGQDLVLAGGRPRGALYAVYTFLEDVVGCRWWTATESTIPRRSTLPLPDLDTVYTPPLRTREAFYSDPTGDPVFAARLKLNGHHHEIAPEYGGHHRILGFVHTFNRLLPPRRYFARHPEWYSEVGGKRTAERAQLCLSDEAMRRELTENALGWIREDPGAGMISISQNDYNTRSRCQCNECLALEQKEGSPAGPLLHFVNAVAADIEKEFPGFLVETLAYQYTRKPPRHVRPRQNVVIRLCSIEADFARPLDADANRAFRDDILGWKAIAPRLYVWDYVTNFTNVIHPHPNLRVLASNLRFFARNNAIAVFEQGDNYSGGVGDFVALRAWLLSHLLWKPDGDATQLTAEFLRGYYGAAAPHLAAYLDLMGDAFERSGLKLSTFQSDHSYLTLDVMNQATRLFAQAQNAVAPDPKGPDFARNLLLSRRVRRERLALDHAWILRYDALRGDARTRRQAFEGPPDVAQAVEEFIRTAREFGVDRYKEGGSFTSYEPRLRERAGPAARTGR